MEKVRVVLDKNSPTKTAQIDHRKSKGETRWVLTVGLEWDGRGARPESRVSKHPASAVYHHTSEWNGTKAPAARSNPP